VHLTSLHLKNFRCFPSIELFFHKQLIVIEGPNGSGKTTLLEALHYVCYGRSFRTRLLADLIADGGAEFFIKATCKENKTEPGSRGDTLVQLGGSAAKRLLKINNQQIGSYKELIDSYRIISITEDDVMMIKGAPELRRLFIDQALSLHNPDYSKTMRNYRHILAQRNSILFSRNAQDPSLPIWTEKLQDLTTIIQTQRTELLALLEKEANTIGSQFIDQKSSIILRYQAKEYSSELIREEIRMRRTLFGAHLDDIGIEFRQTSSRTHASRGQQKLIALILKIAHLRLLAKPVILLLDDFLTDFDGQKIQQILTLLHSLPCQTILTTPLADYLTKEHLVPYDYQLIKL
jgi:DNA replication and repair protein RecF